MAEEKKKVEVDISVLEAMQKQMAELERKVAEGDAKNAGLEELFAKSASTEGEPKIKERKTFEPKFRTVRLRKYSVAGDDTKRDYIIGWTKKGAFQEVDRTGVTPQTVDMIEVIFLSQPKKAEKIKLLDLMNKGEQVHCKILGIKKVPQRDPTGEEIDVTVFDPHHGLVSTGERIDGFVGRDEITYTIQIPGITDPVEINGDFVNA